jgi:hypothetical protein
LSLVEAGDILIEPVVGRVPAGPLTLSRQPLSSNGINGSFKVLSGSGKAFGLHRASTSSFPFSSLKFSPGAEAYRAASDALST